MKLYYYCVACLEKRSLTALTMFLTVAPSSFELGDIDNYDYDDYSMYLLLIHDECYRIDMECIEFMEISLAGFDIFKYDRNNSYTGVKR